MYEQVSSEMNQTYSYIKRRIRFICRHKVSCHSYEYITHIYGLCVVTGSSLVDRSVATLT